jgi:hypothetical protein
MMSYEQWLEYILDIVRTIASRARQERAWLGPRTEVNWVGDLCNALDEDLFDLFFTTYSKEFAAEQLIAWKQFKREFDKYGSRLPDYPDPRTVIEDPEWQVVREAATRFARAFERDPPEASVAAHGG